MKGKQDEKIKSFRRNIMKKKGRKKGSKNKRKGTPTNFACWVSTLQNPLNIDAFVERGNKRQLAEIKHVLRYCKKHDVEIYKALKGDEISKRFQ